MRVSVISFTENGMELSKKVAAKMSGEHMMLYTKCSRARECDTEAVIRFAEQSLVEWAREQMRLGHAMLFIGACGIAVRAIAPCLTDKLQDSPVLVMDEKGGYVVPILSGHVGGGNALALRIAEKVGAVPVITTATDLNQKFAVDLFAKKNGFYIMNKEGIAKVSSKMLAGEEITLSVESGHIAPDSKCPEGIRITPYPPAESVDVVVTSDAADIRALLYLIPREYVIGMGCRKGKEAEQIRELIHRTIQEAGICEKDIFALASIDRKKEEEGFLRWSAETKIPFLTFPAEQLQEMEGDFQTSAFVEKQVGVDNVCERAALRACQAGGKLIWEKRAENGMTIAIARREWSVRW